MSRNTRQDLRCTLQRWRSGEVVCSVVNYPLHRGFRWVGTTHHLLSVGSASWAICRIQTHLRNWLEELRKNNVLSIVVSQDMESFCLQEQSAVCYLGYSPLCLQKCQSPVFVAVCLSQSCAGYIAEAGASALSSLSPPVLVLCCSSAAKVYSDKSPWGLSAGAETNEEQLSPCLLLTGALPARTGGISYILCHFLQPTIVLAK